MEYFLYLQATDQSENGHFQIVDQLKELATEVTPEISVISVGERFASLPSKEVLNRLKESDIYTTKENGGVRVIIDKKGKMKVKTAK